MSNLFQPLVFAVDIGGPSNFAWANSEGEWEEDGDSLIKALTIAVKMQRQIAIGFECPLCIPVSRSWAEIGCAREGEGNRPWSSGAGVTVACFGLVEIGWLLFNLAGKLFAQNLTKPSITFEPERWLSNGATILIWEAFVSGDVKTGSHTEDAQLALGSFMEIEKSGNWGEAKRVRTRDDSDSMNLAAFAANWAQWDIQEQQLRESTLVVKPSSKPRA